MPNITTELGCESRRKIIMVVVGKTGAGKSCTSNTIIGENELFKCSRNATSVTSRLKFEDFTYKDQDYRYIQYASLSSVSFFGGIIGDIIFSLGQ